MNRYQVNITYVHNTEFKEVREFDASCRANALQTVLATFNPFDRHIVESLTVKEI
jgi:hypothetical protein